MDNEKFYGKYKMTEARFSEILESLCGDSEAAEGEGAPNGNMGASFSLGFGAGDAAVVRVQAAAVH